ncbi:MarR family winged helix-turn-helix transcriptional regulator [Bradyrhizobium archetypum]|uniref:MarR family transcriptional regulator n=1 Tax=Bradyrhizobium archetypum TaxID=2721160 RepID=A0A7Y4H278_9BRAD|nr:MarR family transcriptional regulator [Bradyrhizobium archetypum]NOJ45949.1 MarR family transcriptional regulator [Bradyrhizobium archetypum]
MKEKGLTLLKYRVLAILTENDRPLHMGELATLTSVDLSTLSRLIANMHEHGIVHRARVESNQRRVQVTLTEIGHQVYARIKPVTAQYEKLATAPLPGKDVEGLKIALRSICNRIDKLEI